MEPWERLWDGVRAWLALCDCVVLFVWEDVCICEKVDGCEELSVCVGLFICEELCVCDSVSELVVVGVPLAVSVADEVVVADSGDSITTPLVTTRAGVT